MKTFFGIVVGLMLLFSNTMVQAMPPHKKTVPVITVAVTIQNNNATQSLNLQYQPSTVPGIPTPSTSSLTTSVGANLSTLVNIPMLTGNFYLIASYDSNNFCKFNFFVRQDGLYRAKQAYRQGSKVKKCNISVSGKNSVTIKMNMTMPPQLAVEGAYCQQQGSRQTTLTIALFSDGTAIQTVNSGSGYGSAIPCSTFAEIQQGIAVGITGNYTLAPSNKISINLQGNATYRGTYSVRHKAIQTISLRNAGASSGVYNRVQ